MPISVAALMTPKWVARHLKVPAGVNRVILPGHCRGDLAPVVEAVDGVPVEVGPEDLRDLPRFFGKAGGHPEGYGDHSIEILAEINHAPRLPLGEFLAQADRFVAQGADRIDVGCDPGGPWPGVGEYVSALVNRGYKVSVNSFDPAEVTLAVEAGADLVLSVNASNRDHAPRLGGRGRRHTRRPRLARRPRPDRRTSSKRRASRTGSTRSWSRSDSASPPAWAATSKPVAAGPTRRC